MSVDRHEEAVRIATAFHDEYEAAAESLGWETQLASRVNFDELPEKNRTTMLATVKALLDQGVILPRRAGLSSRDAKVLIAMIPPEVQAGVGADSETGKLLTRVTNIATGVENPPPTPPEITDAQIESAAKALFLTSPLAQARRSGRHPLPSAESWWDDLPEEMKDYLRSDARAVLEAGR